MITNTHTHTTREITTVNRRMLPKVNFKAYKKAKFLQAVYNEYGRGVLFNGYRFVRAECPLCTPVGVRSRCCSWSFEKCSFYCHRCKKHGDALELVRLLTGRNVMDAAKWLEEKAGPSGSGLVASRDLR